MFHKEFFCRLGLMVIVAVITMVASSFAQVPQLVNYQGWLTDDSGNPVPDDQYSLVFTIYDVSETVIWRETHASVSTNGGLFNVLLGAGDHSGYDELDETIFADSTRWLGIKVDGDPELEPRTRMVSSPYAFHASSADNYAWHVIDSVLYTKNRLGLSRGKFNNILYGDSAFTMVNLGIACTTGSGISPFGKSFCTVGGGFQNAAKGQSSTVCGGENNSATGWYAVICGGRRNKATAFSVTSGGYATVCGGNRNTASGVKSSILGGWYNIAEGECSAVGGGGYDTASGEYSYVAGYGVRTTEDADYTFAYGRMFRTSTPNAVVFHNSVEEIKVGIGVTDPTNILTIKQGSSTDPVADSWGIYSSRRWKKNIKPIDGALEKVEQLRGVSFDWKSNEKHDIGLIAEEVGDVIPEVVTYEENGIDARSVDYNRLTAVLIEAVKELKTENEELKSRIEVLERQ